jgi:hypothetical protein
MSIMRCPTCGDTIYLGKSVKVGQIITCISCEEILQITSIQPVKIQIFDSSSDEEDEFIPAAVRPSNNKKEKKNSKASSEVSGLKLEVEDFSEEIKVEKKKKPIQRQKIEYFDE